MPEYHIPLLPDHTYHASNKANGREKIFVEDRNYLFFLLKCELHLSPILQLLTYTLLPDHLHFNIQIRGYEEVEEHYTKIKKGKKLKPDLVSDFIMERFSNLFNSYTKAFNKTYFRKGALFLDYLKREEILDEEQFRETVLYIHYDPVRHGKCKKMEDWPWTSFTNDHFNQRATLMNRFGGEKQFLEAHKNSMGKTKHTVLEIA